MKNDRLRFEIAKAIGRCLSQGRKARRISLAQAASMFNLDQTTLMDFEEGIGTLENRVVLQIAAIYGIHLQTIEFLVAVMSTYNQARAVTIKKRNHLSIIGNDCSKPWEIEPESLEELIATVKQQMKGLAPFIFANVDYAALKAVLPPNGEDSDEICQASSIVPLR